MKIITICLYMSMFLFFFSCKKETPILVEVVEESRQYIIETMIIKNQWHKKWTIGSCSGGSCLDTTVIIHPSDSVPESDADYYIDTLYITDTIVVDIYESKNDVIVSGIMNQVLNEKFVLLFHFDKSTKELNIEYSTGDIIGRPNNGFSCYMYEDYLDFNFLIDDYRYSTIYNYIGQASEIE